MPRAHLRPLDSADAGPSSAEAQPARERLEFFISSQLCPGPAQGRLSQSTGWAREWGGGGRGWLGKRDSRVGRGGGRGETGNRVPSEGIPGGTIQEDPGHCFSSVVPRPGASSSLGNLLQM